MSKPTPEQLRLALTEAVRLRESGEDHHYLGKSLLNLNYRIDILEKVLEASDRYLHFGEDIHARAHLLKTLETAKTLLARSQNSDSEENMGL